MSQMVSNTSLTSMNIAEKSFCLRIDSISKNLKSKIIFSTAFTIQVLCVLFHSLLLLLYLFVLLY